MFHLQQIFLISPTLHFIRVFYMTDMFKDIMSDDLTGQEVIDRYKEISSDFRLVILQICLDDIDTILRLERLLAIRHFALIVYFEARYQNKSICLHSEYNAFCNFVLRLAALLDFSEVPFKKWKDLAERGITLIHKKIEDGSMHDWENNEECQAFLKDYQKRIDDLRATGKYLKLMYPMG